MVILLVALLAAAGVVWFLADDDTAEVRTQESVLPIGTGISQVRIDTTLYLPETGTPAPAILLAHGFGGSKDSVAGEAREMAERGFVVLAYSARGFGRSTGEIALNAPDAEVADARELISWLSTRSEVQKDGPNDPRVGVTGASYGGALSLLLAGHDPRVDVLAPVITYNDLGQALIPNAATTRTDLPGTPAAGAFEANGVFKRSWAGIFFAAGMGGAGLANPQADAPEPGDEEDQNADPPAPGGGDPTGGAGGGGIPGAGAPGQNGGQRQAGPMNACGRFRLEICRAYAEVATTGKASQATVDLLRSVSPVSVADRITKPTMIVQGEQDTLFGLDQADATARAIARAGGKVKVSWYTGGHDGGRPGKELRSSIVDWFDFHLRGNGSDPGSGFQYAVQGALRAQGTPSVRTVTAANYPGAASGAGERKTVPLRGEQQTVVNPPGGNPASVSSMPGLGAMIGSSSRLAGRMAIDLPGQVARFRSAPLDGQLLIAGSSTVRLRIAAVPGQPPGEGVFFAKIYDVGPDGVKILPGSNVSAFRVPNLPADGRPVEVTVTLPGIVRPIEAEHAIELAVTTTDQSYATPAQPAAYTVALAEPASLAAPVVPGSASSTGPPTAPLIGIGVVLGLAVLGGIAMIVLRRRRSDVDSELADVPLVIENLSKSYPGGVTAVDSLSFRVDTGQVLGLLGPNGAGKTTTLRMLMGLITPTTGTIRVFGHKIDSGAPVLSRIGSFVEGSGFLPHLSGEANLRLYWAATGRPTEHAHFNEALEIAGLGDAVRRRVRTYSQGMRQRLAIAQAMLGLPDLLVLDEPTNGLDPPQIHQMREVLQKYASTGRTVLVSSHLLAEVEQTCSHVVVMHRGRLIASGEVSDIVAGGGEATFRVDLPDRAAEVLRGFDGVSEVSTEDGVVHASLNGTPRSTAVAALVEAGVAVEQAGPRRRLEDVFLELVGEEASG
ncbi:ABC-2 type transport system ATP-binding protein [Herbihabitans rhizosphaerae]|uniref:ABC-2 type transport system ATP-binding protein n=1 Tax=Herbihabitans rhizosphaerae TaxID=1872711 RepID=A0A4Q7L2G4_9PSEU|nr:ABC-2 type transport system ATP-binding protein [Herbihabitans rhizosphaerae]